MALGEGSGCDGHTNGGGVSVVAGIMGEGTEDAAPPTTDARRLLEAAGTGDFWLHAASKSIGSMSVPNRAGARRPCPAPDGG